MTWTILALLLTGAGAAATWFAFTRRGTTAGLTALGWTLLIPAAWLTGVFALVGRITTAFSLWASRIVLSPAFWTGVALAAVGIALVLVGRLLRRRGLGNAPATQAPQAPAGRKARAPLPDSTTPRGSGDEFDDIEALLRQRGIE